MREVWLIFRREFLERVGSRAFLIGTIAFPLMIGLTIFVPNMVGGGGEDRTIVVVDETEEGIGAALAARLGRAPLDENGNRYHVEVVRGMANELLPGLNARVQAESIDGYLVVPTDLFTANELRYRSATVGSPGMLGDIQIAAAESVRGERLRLAGIDPSVITQVVQPVRIDNARIGEAGEDRGDAMGAFVVAYVLAFLIYFLVLFYGVYVMRSVLEEKTSRIAEVLVSSVRSTQLMAGKILGVAGGALLQVLIWAVLIGLLITRSDWIASRLGIEPEMLGSISIDPLQLALTLAFFLLGFFFYASLFAALGAAVASEQEAQSFQMVLVLPLVMPLLFLVPLTAEPLSRFSTFLGIFPMTAPVAMPMRLAGAQIPAAQVAASLLVLVLALVVMSWIAGKIFRIGILSTGKRPSLKELVRWVRMA